MSREAPVGHAQLRESYGASQLGGKKPTIPLLVFFTFFLLPTRHCTWFEKSLFFIRFVSNDDDDNLDHVAVL